MFRFVYTYVHSTRAQVTRKIDLTSKHINLKRTGFYFHRAVVCFTAHVGLKKTNTIKNTLQKNFNQRNCFPFFICLASADVFHSTQCSSFHLKLNRIFRRGRSGTTCADLQSIKDTLPSIHHCSWEVDLTPFQFPFTLFLDSRWAF